MISPLLPAAKVLCVDEEKAIRKREREREREGERVSLSYFPCFVNGAVSLDPST